MITATRSHVLISELGKPTSDPEFSRIWWAVTSDLRYAITIVALHHCSLGARSKASIPSSVGPSGLGAGVEMGTEEACAILDLAWLTDGKDYWLIDLQRLGRNPNADDAHEVSTLLGRKLASFGDEKLLALRDFLTRHVQQENT